MHAELRKKKKIPAPYVYSLQLAFSLKHNFDLRLGSIYYMVSHGTVSHWKNHAPFTDVKKKTAQFVAHLPTDLHTHTTHVS